MTEWKVSTLDEIYEFASGLSKPRDQFGFGYPFISFKDVFNNYIIPNDLNQLVNTTEKERKSCSVKYGDVFLTRTSETQEELGISSVALKDYPNATFNGFTKRLRPKSNSEIDPKFAAYYFRSPKFRSLITSMASMTTRASLNNEMLARLIISYPSLSEQQSIAEVLSSLDDKIDLLHRQNKNLEQMAETLFRQWFVNVNDVLWEKAPLGKYVTIKRGGSPRPIQNFLSKTGLRWLKISDVSSLNTPFIIDVKECIIEEGLKKTVFLKSGSLVLSNSATPGIPKILAVDSCIHDGWLYFPQSKFSNEFLYLLFLCIKPELEQLGNGSIFTNLKTDILKQYEIMIPPNTVLNEFQNSITPFFEKLYKNTIQISSLEELRNLLLPKLMNGTVRVINN